MGHRDSRQSRREAARAATRLAFFGAPQATSAAQPADANPTGLFQSVSKTGTISAGRIRLSEDRIGDSFGHHHDRRVEVAADNARHDRRIGDAQPVNAVDPALGIDD
jgi:hypothetical protein